MGLTLLTEYAHPQFPDLVNNFSLFHDKYDDTKLSKLDWIDHAPQGYYHNHPHIDDFMVSLSEDSDLSQDFPPCRMPISYIYSSSEEAPGGYDRPIYTSNEGDSKCRENLNEIHDDGNIKGYRPGDAGILNAWLRPCGGGKFQIVKNMGNHRVWKKLLASRGIDSEVLVKINFHEEADLSTYQRKEAGNHSTDAGNRSSQNELHKFLSAKEARKSWAVDCHDFLYEHKLDYHDLMLRDNLRDPRDNEWLSIQSLSGLKNGMGNGFFKKYGEINVISAIKTMKQIALEITRNNCGETVLNAETIRCFSIMFHDFTKYGLKENSPGLFKREQLKNFFLTTFYERNEQKQRNPYSEHLDEVKRQYPLRTLSVTLSVKDPILICAKAFWPDIVKYYKALNNKNNGFDIGCYACQKFIGASDRQVTSLVISEMRKDVDK